MMYSPADLDTLTRTIIGEARGEPTDGRIAVAFTVVNRVSQRPKSISDTCRQHWQYSCWNDGKDGSPAHRDYAYIRTLPANDPVYINCQIYARMVLEGKVVDPTFGSTHYCTLETNPFWEWDWRGQKLLPAAVIGRHKFFNNVRW